ncbi:O-methyltransferase COMT-type [Trema orientale]|uniref:O-methyltransferase COMT-type n=1 Tax=Trema orientale TaxID=63057 RepID=A0A2P5E7N2_TREOI|nr:O-methyltransferase COMT-type [Trema orientale]
MDITNYLSEVSSAELLEAHSLLWNCSVAHIKSMSLKCAVELGIHDTIHNHGQPMTLSELIASLPIHPSKAQYIYRQMRVLVHSGFFTIQKLDKSTNNRKDQEEEYYYSLTLASRLLLKEGALKTKGFFLSQILPEAMAPWHSLSAWFQNNDATMFETSDGRTFWDYLAQDSRMSDIFNEALSSDSQLIAEVVLRECREVFEGLKSMVDLGGGTGTMAKAIAKAFPHISCTVFDLPHVVADLKGSDNNINFIGGDMFPDPIPSADAILLKLVLHDWKDEDSLNILKRCREAVSIDGKKGKVIIIDMVIGDQNIDKELTEIQLSFDMTMMAFTLGKERNKMEWERLLLGAGFSHYKIHPALGVRSLIEVYP